MTRLKAKDGGSRVRKYKVSGHKLVKKYQVMEAGVKLLRATNSAQKLSKKESKRSRKESKDSAQGKDKVRVACPVWRTGTGVGTGPIVLGGGGGGRDALERGNPPPPPPVGPANAQPLSP